MTTGNLTIQDNDTVVQYIAVGESAFNFPFPILASSELKVSKNQGAPLIYGTDYSITGIGDDGGGYITLLLGASTPGDSWTLWQDMPIERLTGFSAGAAVILGTALNAEFAARLRVEQQLRREIRNSLRLAPDDPVSGQDMVLPLKAVRAGKYQAYDANGLPVASAGTGNDSALRVDLATTTLANDGTRLVGGRYDYASAVPFNLHDYIEDDGSYNAMGFIPQGLKGAIRARTSVADTRAYLINALAAAMAEQSSLFIPRGLWNIDGTINITGDARIFGVRAGTYAAQGTRLNHVALNGSLFTATTAEFGGWSLEHFNIIGGSGDGSPCILSRRPQSRISHIVMDSTIGYNNPGIKLEDVLNATTSFGTDIDHCKWVGPQSVPGTPIATAFIGFNINIYGGNNSLYKCAAIFGDIAYKISQGQAIRLIECGANRQYAATSTNTDVVGQMGVLISGAVFGGGLYGFKNAISIMGCYLEACSNHIKVESCESLTIADNIIQGLGFATKPVITLVNGSAQNVTIRNNVIQASNAGATGILASSSNGTLVENNYFDVSGAGGKWMDVTQRVEIDRNTIISGALNDPGKLVVDRKQLVGSAVFDPASLADGAGATTTVACVGAALGDFALASFSLALQGITVTAWVSAVDVVSVRFQNESGGVLDLASGTLRVRVIKG